MTTSVPASRSPVSTGGCARRRSSGSSEHLSAYLAARTTSGESVPWAHVLDSCRLALGAPKARTDGVTTWRKVRGPVLDELARLGLVAAVERTDGVVRIEQHEADVAGLVRVHRTDGELTQVLPAAGGRRVERYRSQVAELLDVRPDGGLPTTLRGFVGQADPFPGVHDVRMADVEIDGEVVWTPREYRPTWLDHVHTWRDRWGDPVLTVEPYAFDAADVVADVAGLALVLDGPYPGVWDDGTTLLVWRFDPNAAVPTAQHRPRVWDGPLEQWVSIP